VPRRDSVNFIAIARIELLWWNSNFKFLFLKWRPSVVLRFNKIQLFNWFGVQIGLCFILTNFTATARNTAQKQFLFGWKLGFSRILGSLYGAFWRCSRVQKVNKFGWSLEHSEYIGFIVENNFLAKMTSRKIDISNRAKNLRLCKITVLAVWIGRWMQNL